MGIDTVLTQTNGSDQARKPSVGRSPEIVSHLEPHYELHQELLVTASVCGCLVIAARTQTFKKYYVVCYMTVVEPAAVRYLSYC